MILLLQNEKYSGNGVLNLELLRMAAAYNKTNLAAADISSNNIPTTVVEGMSDMQVEQVMAKRYIAEICLKNDITVCYEHEAERNRCKYCNR